MSLILITGAAGHVGSGVARLLVAKGYFLRLMAREPGRLDSFPGSDVVRGDYADPDSLVAAFDGVEKAFVVSGYAQPGQRALLHRNAFRAAAQAHVKHLVYLSFQNPSPYSEFPMSRDHHQSEQFLRETGLSYTALRDNLYLDLVPGMFSRDGIMRGPAGRGKAAFVAREDVCRVAAAVLADPPAEQGSYDVSGPEALTMAETAARLSALVGRNLHYHEESPEEGRGWRSTLGAPDWEVETWLGSYRAIAAGELVQTSDTVRKFTGNAPQKLEAYFTRHPGLLDHLRNRPG